MKRREFLTPDLTPLIDVVFILLIFFIVSSVFKTQERALSLALPSSSAKEKEVTQKELTIELSNLQVAYNGEIVSMKDLDFSLSKIQDKQKDIIVRIDKEVKYERVVQVLNALQRHDLSNLALVTEK